MGDTLQAVDILRDDDAMRCVVRTELCVGVTTDNQVEPWHVGRQGDVVVDADVREQDEDITLVTQPSILLDRLLDRGELECFDLFGVGVGRSAHAQLHDADNPYPNPIDIKYLVRTCVDAPLGHGPDVATQIAEI